MFLRFFYELKQSGIPVSVKEYLTFLEAVDSGIADKKIDNFYYLSRASLVKDERTSISSTGFSATSSAVLKASPKASRPKSRKSGCARLRNGCLPRKRRRKLRRLAAGTRSWRS